MSKDTRHVRLAVRYDASLLAPESHEMAPVLSVWSSFEQTKELRFYPVPGVAKNILSDVIQVDLPLPPAGAERRDDALWFEAYALSPSKSGEFVRNRVGSAFVYMSELASHSGEPMAVDLAYFNYWDKDGSRRVKGRLRIERADVGDYTLPDPQTTASSAFDYVPAQNAFLQAEMEDAIRLSIWPYTDMAHAAGESIEPFSDKNRRVHAPAWNGPSGWKPGYTYFVTPGRRAPVVNAATEGHMMTLFNAILARHNMSQRAFVRTVSVQLGRADDTYDDAFTACCDIVGEALCAAAVSMPYIGDSINTASRVRTNAGGRLLFAEPTTHGVESFDWAQLRGGGDCEDFARLIHAYRCAVQDGEWTEPLLKAARGVLNCYIGVGILASVLGAQLSDAKSRSEPYVVGTPRDESVQIGAHMYYQLVPEHKFLAMVKRVNRDLDLARMRNPLAPTASWREKMPHLVLEGTGMLQTLQRPLVSYVTDPDPAAKEAVLRREADLARLETHLGREALGQFRGRTLSIMALVQRIRRQKQQRRTPNARVGFFYRDSTHAFTDDFLRRGYSVAEFTWVNVGQPDLVPADADGLYADDPMLAPPPPDDELVVAGAAEAELTEWEKAGREFQFDSDEDTAAEASAVAAPAPATPHWRKPLLTATELLGPASHKTGTSRFDRFDYADAEQKDIRYGVPLTTALEDRPMRNHVGLLPGPPIDGVMAGVLATHYRHSKPVPLAGETELAFEAEEAQRQSLRANGVDVDELISAENAQIQKFLEDFRAQVSSKWQTKSSYVLFNMFVSTKHFRTPGVGDFIISALRPQARKDVIRYARVQRESFVPGHTSLLIQLLCDPAKF